MPSFLNVIVQNGNVLGGDRSLLFGTEAVVDGKLQIVDIEKTVDVDTTVDIFVILIMLGSFSSRSQAKKNWKHGFDIPPGWSEFWIGKVKRHLCIWNPTA